jgi:hypothetical protein
LPTKAHFSSNWTSWVAGGKSHEFVVELPGLVAGQAAEPADGVVLDSDEPSGLAGAAALGEVVQDGEGLGLGEAGVEQGGALALGEAVLAGAAGEHPPLLAGAVAEADPEVVPAALTVIGALRVLAAEGAKVIHGRLREQLQERLDSVAPVF